MPSLFRPSKSGTIEVRAEIPDDKEADLAEPTRLEALSDGAFAIIITLLVIEIHRPNATPGRLAGELLRNGVISFGLVAYYASTSQGVRRTIK